ncbi:MAG: DNA internalization-related competence protein ComEC/Rec2, partial [Rhodothermales bacterium]|nr:DNA internalization-related competence protein ComEC/Rec2 [Rhodothermales bacterium]
MQPFSLFPALPPALSLGAGALLGGLVPASPYLVTAIGLIALLVAVAMQSRSITVSLILACLSISCYSANRVQTRNMQAAFSPAPSHVTIVGRVSSAPASGRFSTQFYLKDIQVLETGETITRLIVRVPSTSPGDEVARGDLFGCQARLKIPASVRNPGGFDYARYLRRRGVGLEASCSKGPSIALRSIRSTPSKSLPGLRKWISRQINESVKSRSAQTLLHALVLGDRSGIDPGVRRNFQETGLAHVLAVSGLHVLLIVLSIFWGIRPLLVRTGLGWYGVESVRLVICTFVLLIYSLVSGASPSVVRASTMAMIFMGSPLSLRPASSINSLAAAAVVILSIDPIEIFGVGFQLSFAAVLSIVSITSGIMQPVAHRPRLKRILEPFAVTLAATAGTAPILLSHFGSFSFAGFVLNPIAIPATAATLASGILAIITNGVGIGDMFGNASSFFAAVLVYVTEAGNSHIRATIHSGIFDITTWVMCLLLSISLFVWRFRKWRGRMVLLLLALMVLMTFRELHLGIHEPRLDVIFLDVGQGDAAIVRGPCGENILIDTGPGDLDYSAGARAIYDVSRIAGIDRFDAVIISHPHSDHLGGLYHLLEMVDIERILQSENDYDSELFRKTSLRTKLAGVSEHVPGTATTVDISPCFRTHILGRGSQADVNNRSLVV